MRIPRSLAWVLLFATFFTAGLLRRFHEDTPLSPFFPPAVGSLLFALILFLGLVAIRERRAGPAPGPGIRLGSLTPILLMLLVEKWVSIALFNPVFYALLPDGASSDEADAYFRAFAGAGLLAVCALIASFSRPALAATRATLRPAVFARGLLLSVTAVGGAYAVLFGLGRILDPSAAWTWPSAEGPARWVLAGQALRALSEEVYYRGFLLWEMFRLAPRLGARSPAARRWAALLPVGLLFGMEHVTLYPTPSVSAREALFATTLGILFGLLVLIGRDLGLATGVHAWVNALVLGAAPRVALSGTGDAIATGSYVALALIFAFIVAWIEARVRARAAHRAPS